MVDLEITQDEPVSVEPETEPEPYVRQGEEFEPGTRVHVVGEHAPNSPPPIGVVIGHVPSPPREAERRHVLHMEYGQVPDTWTIEFSALENIDEYQEQSIVDAHAVAFQEYLARQAEHEAREVAHANDMAQLIREAEVAELRARIATAQALAVAASEQPSLEDV